MLKKDAVFNWTDECKHAVEQLKINPPRNVKEVHSFLSTANYYLKFVPHFAEIARKRRLILKKDAVFNWTD